MTFDLDEIYNELDAERIVHGGSILSEMSEEEKKALWYARTKHPPVSYEKLSVYWEKKFGKKLAPESLRTRYVKMQKTDYKG
jgi:hypothetical protein